jgi:hypothetical protein
MNQADALDSKHVSKFIVVGDWGDTACLRSMLIAACFLCLNDLPIELSQETI